MITDFDDYLIHQAPFPVNQPGLPNRNFYDRYWFNGFDKAGKFLFEIGFGRYPHRFVQDGHFSVTVDGVQHSFHASRRVADNPMDSTAGPLRVEVVQPMRIVRVVIEPNDTEVECDLTFRAKAPPIQEPKNIMYDGTRLIMDTQRFTQYGTWEGFFSIKGRRFEVKRREVIGNRDKSWGMRPVGEYEDGAPSKLTTDPGVYWIWSPLHFDGFCTHFLTREMPDGYAQELAASIVKTYGDEEEVPKDVIEADEEVMATARHQIRWRTGTRWPESATLDLVSRDGKERHIELEPMLRFHMMGIGYQHPEWAHAVWRDELDTGYESWKLDEVEPDEYCTIHVHNVVRAKMGEQTGIGILETLVFGRHAPSGFADLFDGAP
ncbi:MAG: hypothetical protein O7F08_04875 [Deltaproteobacteria bacterium]|nr:hypothetical protein [Deltaproteobacteria bacterium]